MLGENAVRLGTKSIRETIADPLNKRRGLGRDGGREVRSGTQGEKGPAFWFEETAVTRNSKKIRTMESPDETEGQTATIKVNGGRKNERRRGE